ncbi:MAG: RNA polymerase sigma factor [Deltaproteobacteria bacterium]|nr:RNA polymerase sigma factor [Deltaproteobacteria bacterium]
MQYQVMTSAPPSPAPVDALAAPCAPAEGTGDEGAALLARHIAGEGSAFPALVRAFQSSIYGFFLRSVDRAAADDLFQETFMRVHKDARRYEPRRPFRVWLFTIAHNLLRSHHRKRVVRRVLVDWWVGGPSADGERRPLDPADTRPIADEVAATRERLRWLEAALGELPERVREALVLTQLEGLSLEQAAEVMRVPIGTVKTWVFRGRNLLVSAREAHERGKA